MIKLLIIISLGSILGALARFGLIKFSEQYLTNLHLPVGILIANILGSFSIGFLLSFSPSMSLAIKNFLYIGFLGSFTTFSSFSEEGYVLLNKNTFLGLVYVAISVTGGIFACYLGHWIGARFNT